MIINSNIVTNKGVQKNIITHFIVHYTVSRIFTITSHASTNSSITLLNIHQSRNIYHTYKHIY